MLKNEEEDNINEILEKSNESNSNNEHANEDKIENVKYESSNNEEDEESEINENKDNSKYKFENLSFNQLLKMEKSGILNFTQINKCRTRRRELLFRTRYYSNLDISY